jgi:hypothetical protein
VAAFLTEEGVSELGKCRHAGGAGNDGKGWHVQAATLMSTTS